MGFPEPESRHAGLSVGHEMVLKWEQRNVREASSALGSAHGDVWLVAEL